MNNKGNIDPEGVAHFAVRALIQSACLYSVCYPRVLATLVPPVTERGRFQRPAGATHADNRNYSANNIKKCPFGQKSNKSIQNLSNL